MNLLKPSYIKSNSKIPLLQCSNLANFTLLNNKYKSNQKSVNSFLKTNSFCFALLTLYRPDPINYSFKKQEYDRAYRFLSEEMKDIKSLLVYSRKFPFSPFKLKLSQVVRHAFYNAIMYLFYTNGIYNFMFIWLIYNISFYIKLLVSINGNSRKVSSIFLIKTQNDFTNETEFYFIIGYGFRKNVKVINLLNFHYETRAEIEKQLFVLDDTKLINLGYNVMFMYWFGNILIFNREIFKYFFKQDRLSNGLPKQKNKNEGGNEIEVCLFLIYLFKSKFIISV